MVLKTIKKMFIVKRNIYVPYSRPNGWDEWADFFLRESMDAPGVT